MIATASRFTEIADALMQHLDARGALVVIEAEHLCMKIRGVQKANASMVTWPCGAFSRTTLQPGPKRLPC